MLVLKEEINQAGSAAIELAKWKLIVLAGVATVGLGWTPIAPDTESAILVLYMSGLLCAYIDMLLWRRYIIVHSIAAYIRGYEGGNEDLLEMKRYEDYMRGLRNKRRFYISERVGHLVVSCVFVVGLVGLAWKKYDTQAFDRLIWLIPAIALALIICLYCLYEKQRSYLLESTERTGTGDEGHVDT